MTRREPAPRAGHRILWTDGLLSVFLAVLALFLALPRTMLGGLRRVPGDCGDNRLNHFLLEHTWGWLTGEPRHEVLWDLPIFFPVGENSYAYTDFLLTFAPPYWLYRALGASPDSAHWGWLVTMLGLNFAVAFLLLRRAVGVGRLPAALGAYLIAFPISRLNQIGHSQLMPMFFVLVGIWAVLRYGQNLVRAQETGDDRVRRRAIGVMALATVAQLYGAFYTGAFWLLSLAVLTLCALTMGAFRRPLLQSLRRDVGYLLAGAAASALLLVPWMRHYLAAASEVGYRSWDAIAGYIPRPISWIFVSPFSDIYGWMIEAPPFSWLGAPLEQAIGIGFVTTLVTLAIYWRSRHLPAMQLLAVTGVVLVLSTTLFFGHKASIWRVLFEVVPGVSAMRAVSRIGMFILPLLAAFAIAWLVDRVRGRERLAVFAIALLCCLEQKGTALTSDALREGEMVDSIVARINPEVEAFYLTQNGGHAPNWLLHIDAMWAGERAGIPSVNGYSGQIPPDWPDDLWPAKTDRRWIRRHVRWTLTQWLAEHGQDPSKVQFLQLEPGYRSDGGAICR
ncbi:MAG: hypothetical protein AAF481_15885 [Acidobacteriota bacterium]